MLGRHHIWGGPLEIHAEDPNAEFEEEQHEYNKRGLDRAAYRPLSEEVKLSWLLRPDRERRKKKTYYNNKNVAFIVGGCIFFLFLVIIAKYMPGRHRHHTTLSTPDNYTIALQKALFFFNAQRSGRLGGSNNVTWRGDSCLKDDQIGGYFDGGDAAKYNFPAAFSMTMLSWSVIEYSQKYEAALSLDHVKGVIKWGTDYLLNTFNSSANATSSIASHISDPTQHKCWMRPEEIDHARPASQCSACPALAAETAAALASASIVFQDDNGYSKKLIHGASILFEFATRGKGEEYYGGADPFSTRYNSTGYWDEFLWAGTWMYFATGNNSYLEFVTGPTLAVKFDLMVRTMGHGVLGWDNKLPGALLLLTRLRMFLSYGYPYEGALRKFHAQIDDVMCSYLPNFKSYGRTKGGLILLNHGNPSPLQYVVNAAFLAKLYGDYMDTVYVPGMLCGGSLFDAHALRDFAKTQMNYILGNNPQRMSYVVGFGGRYPERVHHMGASIPFEKGKRYGCGGWKWRDSKGPNPNVVVGAMVAGPDKFDGFRDVRYNYNYTEPTLAGNSGLVAALVALSEANKGGGVDVNTMFYSLRQSAPPPPPPSSS